MERGLSSAPLRLPKGGRVRAVIPTNGRRKHTAYADRMGRRGDGGGRPDAFAEREHRIAKSLFAPHNSMISRLAATGIVAVAALLGVLAEVPTVWSPLNVLGFIPAIWASVLFDGAGILAPVPFAAAFACWCPRVWTGQAAIPRRSQVAAGLAIILSLTNVVLGRSYGLRYQGNSYVNTVTVVSVLCCAAIGLFGPGL